MQGQQLGEWRRKSAGRRAIREFLRRNEIALDDVEMVEPKLDRNPVHQPLQRVAIFESSLDARAKFALASRMTSESPLAPIPIPGGRVDQRNSRRADSFDQNDAATGLSCSRQSSR